MKINSLAWSAIAIAALLLVGCSGVGMRADGEGATIEDRGTSGAVTSGANAGGAWTGNPLDDPNSLLSTKTIYFEFDQSTIRSEFVDVLRAHAAYLNSNGSASVRIEGHADERGSREYNIGLGERRANAVKSFLEAEGVSSSQLNTISYGEERPASLGHDEISWAENRRAVLVY
ncbi:MAG: peptidoglycan-associated lipoprotein Pal [Gammaproteobacteria bacterium]|nr:peptidoglycan-associated lipoprotein Pal [Gammaproteobacteria bacterium]